MAAIGKIIDSNPVVGGRTTNQILDTWKDGIFSSFPQLFYPLMTRQFFCDFHEKSEDFCVS